jgi:hypothetical protein
MIDVIRMTEQADMFAANVICLAVTITLVADATYALHCNLPVHCCEMGT